MNNQAQFVCLWCCTQPDFVFQINNFFNLVLLSAVIHKRKGKKLISKTIKYKLESSSEMQFAFFYLKDIQKVFSKTIDFVENLEIWKWRNSRRRGGGVMFFVWLWRNAYENWYVIHPLSAFEIIFKETVGGVLRTLPRGVFRTLSKIWDGPFLRK